MKLEMSIEQRHPKAPCMLQAYIVIIFHTNQPNGYDDCYDEGDVGADQEDGVEDEDELRRCIGPEFRASVSSIPECLVADAVGELHLEAVREMGRGGLGMSKKVLVL